MVLLNEIIQETFEGKILYISDKRIGGVESARVDAGGFYYKVNGEDVEQAVTWPEYIDFRDS
ncbi:hypothetical protein HNV12_00620 [Methanococcoides sp. SA1]|nr:hypothetical protein [Methanococcoides sp. SA1]